MRHQLSKAWQQWRQEVEEGSSSPSQSAPNLMDQVSPSCTKANAGIHRELVAALEFVEEAAQGEQAGIQELLEVIQLGRQKLFDWQRHLIKNGKLILLKRPGHKEKLAASTSASEARALLVRMGQDRADRRSSRRGLKLWQWRIRLMCRMRRSWMRSIALRTEKGMLKAVDLWLRFIQFGSRARRSMLKALEHRARIIELKAAIERLESAEEKAVAKERAATKPKAEAAAEARQEAKALQKAKAVAFMEALQKAEAEAKERDKERDELMASAEGPPSYFQKFLQGRDLSWLFPSTDEESRLKALQKAEAEAKESDEQIGKAEAMAAALTRALEDNKAPQKAKAVAEGKEEQIAAEAKAETIRNFECFEQKALEFFFKVCDINNTGKVSSDDLRSLIKDTGGDLTDQEFQNFFNHGNKLNLDEFRHAWLALERSPTTRIYAFTTSDAWQQLVEAHATPPAGESDKAQPEPRGLTQTEAETKKVAGLTVADRRLTELKERNDEVAKLTNDIIQEQDAAKSETTKQKQPNVRLNSLLQRRRAEKAQQQFSNSTSSTEKISWTVDSFEALPCTSGDNTESLEMAAVGYAFWRINCYPGGETSSDAGQVGLFLRWAGPKDRFPQGVSCCLRVVNQQDPAASKASNMITSDWSTARSRVNGRGIPNMIERELLLDPAKGFILEGRVIFEAELTRPSDELPEEQIEAQRQKEQELEYQQAKAEAAAAELLADLETEEVAKKLKQQKKKIKKKQRQQQWAERQELDRQQQMEEAQRLELERQMKRERASKQREEAQRQKEEAQRQELERQMKRERANKQREEAQRQKEEAQQQELERQMKREQAHQQEAQRQELERQKAAVVEATRRKAAVQDEAARRKAALEEAARRRLALEDAARKLEDVEEVVPLTNSQMATALPSLLCPSAMRPTVAAPAPVSAEEAAVRRWLAEKDLEELTSVFMSKHYSDVGLMKEIGLDEGDLDFLEIHNAAQRAILLSRIPIKQEQSFRNTSGQAQRPKLEWGVQPGTTVRASDKMEWGVLRRLPKGLVEARVTILAGTWLTTDLVGLLLGKRGATKLKVADASGCRDICVDETDLNQPVLILKGEPEAVESARRHYERIVCSVVATDGGAPIRPAVYSPEQPDIPCLRMDNNRLCSLTPCDETHINTLLCDRKWFQRTQQFVQADQIRDTLESMGVVLWDSGGNHPVRWWMKASEALREFTAHPGQVSWSPPRYQATGPKAHLADPTPQQAVGSWAAIVQGAATDDQVSQECELQLRPQPSTPDLSAVEPQPSQAPPTCNSTDSTQSSLECAICMANEKGAALIPCGHACACWECSANLETCPICRQPVTDRLRIIIH